MSSYLVHSAKGTSWSNHKYTKIENGKYIYDKAKTSNTSKDENEGELNDIEDVKDSNKWGRSGKTGSKSSTTKQNPQTEEERLATEREKLENEVAIKQLKEQLEPEKSEDELAAEQAAKEKVEKAKNYISSFNATYKNTPTSKIPKERLAKYRENMAVVMNNTSKEQK